MYDLYKNTHVTIKCHGNEYYGPIKTLWQTFNSKIIEVPYNGKWYPAKLIGNECARDLVQLNDTFICAANTIIHESTEDKKAEDCKYEGFKRLEEQSEWLFGVEFIDPENQYYTTTSGITVSTK